jgi:DNA-binding GntR family transcriptional regulator
LYYQLKTAILDAIERGELQPGDMLPAKANKSEPLASR